MPRSRSRSFESITRSSTCSCAAKVPDCCSSLSTSVVLPWSTWAMMAMLRRLRIDFPSEGRALYAMNGCVLQRTKSKLHRHGHQTTGKDRGRYGRQRQRHPRRRRIERHLREALSISEGGEHGGKPSRVPPTPLRHGRRRAIHLGRDPLRRDGAAKIERRHAVPGVLAEEG